ncbi:MAG: hypothetical protein M1528_00235 [Candidatus Marsarchaeota archaeon]|nr:hypothetical protein [Candidatus Marsarchaeota archaeon]MCL5114959.1 hypothetical protein [Candidatus Marsarchaeota archaeon]
MKYIESVRRIFGSDDFPVFTIRDLRIALSDRKVSKDYLYLLLHKLASSGEITRITRGIYTFHNDDVFVAGFAFEPFYYGLECALSIRGLSTQGANPIVITTRNVRAGVRTFRGRNYVIRKIKRDYFFGYEPLKYGRFWVPASGPEKTVIDLVYFGYGIRDDLLDGINKSIDMKKLNAYLKRYGAKFRGKVLSELKTKEKLSMIA